MNLISTTKFYPVKISTYIISINLSGENEEVLVDYFVLLPGEYTDPSILRLDVTEPCLRNF